MNEKVKILTDSGCDIPPELEEQYKDRIEILPFLLSFNGNTYVDRKDIVLDDFYKLLKENDEIPKHSQLTAIQFEEKYRELYEQGVREIIVDVINSAGSQTYSNAVLAKQNVAEELLDLKIYTVDSQNYTLAYGFPIIEACKKLDAGQTVESVVAYLEDWGRHAEAYIVGFDLRHMKKSGRITAAASFLGELMGLKPIIKLAAEKTAVLRKARGEKAAIESAVETVAASIIPETPWCIVTTTRPDCEKELIEKLTKKLGYGPAMVAKTGAVVSVNAGPEFIGIIIRGQERPATSTI